MCELGILIFSKDRPLQLHLLLESLSENFNAKGLIALTLQTSSEKYKKAIDTLLDRVQNGHSFAKLREKFKIKIFFRDNFADVYKAFEYLSKCAYFLPLVDDEIFYRSFNLIECEGFKEFKKNKAVFCYQMRLGKNITPTLPSPHDQDWFLKPSPKFLNNSNFLMWNWIENLNTYHWSIISSVTGVIYRYNEFKNLIDRFGKENILKIEGKGKKFLLTQSLRYKWMANTLIRLDNLYERILFKFFKRGPNSDIISFGFKLINKIPFFRSKSFSPFICSPLQSANISLDFNSHQDFREIAHSARYTMDFFCEEYLNDKVIDKDKVLGKVEFNEPLIRDQNRIPNIELKTFK